MTDGWSIVLFGATGAVGRALLEQLQSRHFPVGELYLLASERSVGKSIRFNGRQYRVQEVDEFDWSQAQLAFFVAGRENSQRYAPVASQAGCLVIDSSDAFAMEPDVPLVVPGVNSQVLSEYRNRNIVAVADSLCSQLLTAIHPLIQQEGVAHLQVINLMAVSAQGKGAVEALAGQTARLLNGLSFEPDLFQQQLAFNLLPLLPDPQGIVAQERRLVDQVRKVLQDEGLAISASCVQAPVFYGHSQAVQLQTCRPLLLEEARFLLENSERIQVSEEHHFPTPVGEGSSNQVLNIGCLRYDYGLPACLQFWSVADNIGFGGALMALETAECLIREHLY